VFCVYEVLELFGSSAVMGEGRCFLQLSGPGP
jgi:hypothetical protein